jgi:GH24 family phage-related lysozyme (muramidase)
MSVRSEVLLLAVLEDSEEVTACDDCTNIDLMNRYLARDYPDSKPQFVALAPITYVYGVGSIKNLDEEALVEAFRRIPWFEPSNTTLMIRKDGESQWASYTVRRD